jgi:hypothetical protein
MQFGLKNINSSQNFFGVSLRYGLIARLSKNPEAIVLGLVSG